MKIDSVLDEIQDINLTYLLLASARDDAGRRRPSTALTWAWRQRRAALQRRA